MSEWSDELTDEDWLSRQSSRRTAAEPSGSATRASAGFSVADWVKAVDAAKRSEHRVFVLLNLFAGDDREGDIQQFVLKGAEDRELHVLMLNADLATDWRWDLSIADTFAILMGQAEQGDIDAVVGGPPCSTWSRARFVWWVPGPRPVRYRGEYVWGIPGLTASEKARVQEANVLLIHFLAL